MPCMQLYVPGLDGTDEFRGSCTNALVHAVVPRPRPRPHTLTLVHGKPLGLAQFVGSADLFVHVDLSLRALVLEAIGPLASACQPVAHRWRVGEHGAVQVHGILVLLQLVLAKLISRKCGKLGQVGKG